MRTLADLLARRRALVAAGVILVSAVALAGIGALDFDDVPRHLFLSDDEESAAVRQMYDDFGADDNDCVLVVEADDLFTPEAVAVVRNMVRQAREVEGVRAVISLDDAVVFERGVLPRSLLPPSGSPPAAYRQARRDALSHPLLAGQIVAEDARTTLIIVRLAEDRIAIPDMAEVIRAVRAIARESSRGTGIRVSVTGLSAVRVEIYEMLPREQSKFMALGALVGGIVAYLLIRRIAGVAIVTAGGVTGAMWTLGALGIVSEKVNVLNSILPTLVLVIGFTDAVHLMHHIRAARREGMDRMAAACSAVRCLGPACGLTSLTTAIGFGSLALTGVPIIQRMGLACAAGVALTLAAVLLVLPLLSGTRFGEHVHRRPPSSAAAWLAPYTQAGIRFVLRHARLTSAVGMAVTALLVATALRLEPDSRLRESIPTDGESARAILHCDEAFGGVVSVSVIVEWPADRTLASPDVLGAIAEVEALLGAEPATHHPLSVLDLLAALPGAEPDAANRVPSLRLVPEDLRRRFVRLDHRRARITARVPDIGTAAFEAAVADLRQGLDDLQRRYPGITMRLTGTPVVATGQLNRMIQDLAASLGLAALVIFGVMSVALGSVRLGLLTVLPNAFPLAVTGAALVVAGRHLELTSVIVFSICLGVAVDDTIHFVMRFRRELLADDDVHAAIERTFTAVGSVLAATTAVLVGGFGVVLFGQMPTMRLFAALACTALLAALIGDLILLPALLAAFGQPRRRQRAIPSP